MNRIDEFTKQVIAHLDQEAAAPKVTILPASFVCKFCAQEIRPGLVQGYYHVATDCRECDDCLHDAEPWHGITWNDLEEYRYGCL